MGIDYSVLGLRTRESKEFINYFNYVQAQAQKRNMIFFLDSAEGCETYFRDMEIVDLSGWLIPQNRVNEFEKVWQAFEEDDNWVEYYCFDEPKLEGEKIIIEFKYY